MSLFLSAFPACLSVFCYNNFVVLVRPVYSTNICSTEWP